MAGISSIIGNAANAAGVGSAASAAGTLAGRPATNSNLTYDKLRSQYYDFTFPLAEVSLGGRVFNSDSGDMIVNDIHVELSAGFEASVASFRISNVYDGDTGFRFEQVKSQVLLGNSMSIKLGYLGHLETVFVGFVAGVTFGYEPGRMAYIEVTGMDIKGLLMGNTYAAQCTARTYSGAVKEVLERTGYKSLVSAGGVTAIEVDDTPDAQAAGASGSAAGIGDVTSASGVTDAAGITGATSAAGITGGTGITGGIQQKESAYTVELVSESDYEFVVKAAKKFNYEFFVDRGLVLFRKAKKETSTLATLGSGSGIESFQVEYSITGIVGEIEARAMDPGEGRVITAKDTYPGATGAISTSSKAKSLVGSGKKVYIDPTIDSAAQAEARVASLKEKMSYRLGSLEADCVGIPELVPGRFIRLSGLGTPVDNDFYLTTVVHTFTSDGGFKTRIVGQANKVDTGQSGAAGALGGIL